MDELPEAANPAAWPAESTLAEAQTVPAPHPAILGIDDFVSQCRLTAHRRGGPGGQHRNKVSSAVMALHLPTGISAEANERRDQSQNRRVAIERLRLRLAIVLRSRTQNNAPMASIESDLRQRWHRRALKVSESNWDRSAVLAVVLDDLHRAGGQPSLIAERWQLSTTSIVQFVASSPPAFQMVNRWREHHRRPPLRA